ncbi:glycosyltransferase [Reinekea marinisedimentorum]|uniref:Glycosyl transferase family 1 n=1 Tax=Reinekea marinisedimentorum TaxID=230495 RepID=A0A4R3IAY9_9GAMM|nr:glycosyltransferase family 4 protein [Reinekea marinisedimentorum]TCS43144.1 glycosyl transferase family 1 [Reinekea marinisedimentorum]
MKALLIAKNWPEPNSTAAGRRTLCLLRLLAEMDYDIHVASAAEKTPFQASLAQLGYTETAIAVNDSRFDAYISKLKPTLVIYDRFVMEEQFGWRVKKAVPEAMTLLDTSDLHCLRVAREKALKGGGPMDLFSEEAIREITSLLRCDLTLMISRVEMEILQSQFSIAPQLLHFLPFLVNDEDYHPGRSFHERRHLIMLGGFKHAPNRDAALWLKQSLWPHIRKQLPADTELHIYGGYADHAINQLHNPSDRFFIKGRAECALTTISRYRVNLAPLRFGAGQKGKILEGWLTGTPTLTSPIGAESMASSHELHYQPTDNPEQFAQLTAQAYSNEHFWQQLQQAGFDLLTSQYQYKSFASGFHSKLNAIRHNLTEHRHQNFFGRLLWQNQFRASEFMSRWIEQKNAK